MQREILEKSIRALIWAVLLPAGLYAQTSSMPAMGGVPVVFGNGGQSPLRFQGEAASANQFSLAMGASTFYDNNVFQEGTQKIGDEALSLNSNIAFTRQTQNVTFNFSYQPFFLIYKNTDQLDRLNDVGTLNLNYRASPRFIIGLFDSASYQNGAFQSGLTPTISSGLASPNSLNQFGAAYTVRTLANMSGLNLTFLKSSRSSFTISGSYNEYRFGSQQMPGSSLYNSREATGGFQYQFRVTEHTGIGFALFHQDSTYNGGTGFGSNVRFQNESAFFFIQSKLSPTVTLSLNGGLQYPTVFGQSSTGGAVTQFTGAGGGSITKQVKRTAFSLSAQRATSDSGGLYTLVESTSVSLGVRRQLLGRWQGGVSAAVNRMNTSLLQLGNGYTDSLSGGADLTRPISNGASFHISFLTMQEKTSGSTPILTNYGHDQVTVGVDFRLKAIPIGH